MPHTKGTSYQTVKDAMDAGTFEKKSMAEWGRQLGVTRERIRQLVRLLGGKSRPSFAQRVLGASDRVAALFENLERSGLLKREGSHLIYTGCEVKQPFGVVRNWVYDQTHKPVEFKGFRNKAQKTHRYTLFARPTCGQEGCINPEHLTLERRRPINYNKERVKRGKRIIDLLLKTDRMMIDIAKDVGVTIAMVGAVNRGRSWRNPDLSYPLRPVRGYTKRDTKTQPRTALLDRS